MKPGNDFLLSEAQLISLQNKWRNLVIQFDEKPDEQMRDMVFNCHSERHRKYHNLSHVYALLDDADIYQKEIRDFNAVCFAIWFHDVIYQTRRNDNEEKSAQFASKVLKKLSVLREMAEKVRQMILATKHHDDEHCTADCKLFTDLDLSILGASRDRYAAYQKAIREEYAWVPNFMYKKARKKVLTAFLKKDQIYSSGLIGKQLERQARENITMELSCL